MSLTTITPLPPAMSRLTKPETFLSEMPVFVDALVGFVNQVNTNNLEVSLLKPNRWNMGTIEDEPSFPSFTPYTDDPDSLVKPSIEYVSSLDTVYQYMESYSNSVGSYMSWFDTLTINRGSVDVWSSSFNILDLSEPMTRVMGITEFNTKSSGLVTSLRDHTNSLKQVQMSAESLFNGTEDLGTLTGTVTETIDCGLITDTTIEN